jgi:Flp pilus assembly secretin CpaC
MRAFVSLGLAAILAAAIAGPALAASASVPSIIVPIDQQTRLSLAGSAYSVLVGNPAVADVTVIDSHTLYISGRGYGSTDVEILDISGAVLYRGDVVVTGSDVGRVSVYRGSARTDMACAPGCQVATRSSAGAAAGGGASSNAPGGASTLSGALAAVAGTP